MQRVVLAFWVLGLGAAWGQDKYAAEPLVVLHNDRVYRMEADGTGVMEQSIAGRIQSEAGLKQVGVLAVPFASKSQHVEWDYARVKHADGTVVETPVSSAIEVAEQVTREAPFYSDLKESQLPLKDLRVGDTLESRARVVMTTPEAEGNFWGQENFAEGGGGAGADHRGQCTEGYLSEGMGQEDKAGGDDCRRHADLALD